MKLATLFRTVLFLIFIALFSIPVFATINFIAPPTNNYVFNLTEDTPFNYTIIAVDTDGDPVNFTDTSQDPDVGFFCFRKYNNYVNQTFLNFTCGNEYARVEPYKVYIIAEDDNNDSVLRALYFNVTNTNDAPVINFTAPANFSATSEDGTAIFQIIISDDDLIHDDNISFYWYVDGILENATGGKLTSLKVNNTHSNATYTPSFTDFEAGLHNITAVVIDQALASVNYTWIINITNVNRPPIFNKTIDDIIWNEDSNLTNNFTLMDHFYDVDNSYSASNSCFYDNDTSRCLEFGYDLINGSSGKVDIVFDNATGNVSFYPISDWFGVLIVQFYVDDGFVRNYSSNVTLNVSNIQDAPSVNSIANQTTYAFTEFSYQVTANDLDNDPLIYYAECATLANITISGTGYITHSNILSNVGNHTVTIKVSDTYVNSTVYFNLEIINNSKPVIVPIAGDYTNVTQNDQITVTISAVDADIDTLDFWSNSTVVSSDVRHNATAWNFTFIPTQQSLVGNHTIHIFVNDSHDSMNQYNFTLQVFDLPQSPSIYPVFITNNQTKVNMSVIIDAFAFDEDGNIESFFDNTTLFNISTTSQGSISNNATGLISFTPTQIGYHQINISVNDTDGYIDSTILIINITANRAPYFTNLINITCQETRDCTYKIIGADPDWQDENNLVFFFNITTPTNDSNFFMNSSGYINFTPPTDENYTVNITISDGFINYSQIIIINITQVNDPPVFVPEDLSTMSIWANITENITVTFNISAYDPENEPPYLNVSLINFTDLNGTTYTTNMSLENKLTFSAGVVTLENVNGTPRNVTSWTFSFSPAYNEVGDYWIKFNATDLFGVTDQIFIFTVQNFNNPPVVNWSVNYTFGNTVITNSDISYTTINCTENTTIEFISNAYDYDFQNLTYNWTIFNNDGTQDFIGNTLGINYTIPFNAYPNQTMQLIVTDEDNATTTVRWNLNSTNVNRDITFGIKRFNFNASGDYYNTTYENSIMLLDKINPTDYYSKGAYVSNTIDFETYSHDRPRIRFKTINLTNIDSNNTYSINLTTASSRTYADPLTIWNEVPANLSIPSVEYRYFAYKIEINSTNISHTPRFSNVEILYEIDNLSVYPNEAYNAWLNLEHFFNDPDTDDTLTYGYRILEGGHLINITFDSGSVVSLEFFSQGEVTFVFNATDQYNSAIESNNITIEIKQLDEVQTETTSSTGGGGRVQTQYQYKRVKSPVALDIIHPEEVTIYGNGTIEIPIRLVNNEEFNLNEITINSYVDREGLGVSLDVNEILKLEKGASETVIVTLNVTKIYDSYGVFIEVNVTEPEYYDTAKILITSLKRLDTSNESQQMKLAFVKDLLSKNLECVELTEYIARAQEYLNEEDYDRSDELLEQFINDCKLLIQEKRVEVEEPKEFKNYVDDIIKDRENLIIAVTLISILLISILFIIIIAYKKI